MTTFRILEADDWGFRFSEPPVKELLGDPEIYIHHRAGNGRHLVPAERAFYEMNEGAIADKDDPKSATDYDILVHEHTPSNTVTIGIARGPWRSAATKDRNEQGEAICAMGYFHPGHPLSEKPSAGMIEGIARACVLSIERGWSASDAVVLGHRQNPAHPDATSCPGDYLFAVLPTIRARVAELLIPEDDMQLAKARIKGYQDQFLMVPVTEDTNRRISAEAQSPIVITSTLTRAQLEAEFGYQLTPMPDGN